MKFYIFADEDIRLRKFNFTAKTVEDSEMIVKISKDDELSLREILKQKSYIDRLIGFCVEDDFSLQVKVDEAGLHTGGNVGLILKSPNDKYHLVYTLRGYSASPDLLGDLYDMESLSYHREKLLALAQHFASCEVAVREPIIHTVLNNRLRFFLDDALKPVKAKTTLIVPHDATENDVLDPDLTDEQRAEMRVKFKPIPSFVNPKENLPGLVRCHITQFFARPPSHALETNEVSAERVLKR